MKLTIRKGMFETNSSSMHSIIITKKEDKYTEKELEGPVFLDGRLVFYEEDLSFCRSPFNFLNTWDTKVAYTIASYCQSYETRSKDAIEFLNSLRAIIKKHVKWFDRFEFPDHSYSESFYPFGYVDHQSEGLLQKFLSEEDITLEDFIFMPKYIVVIDGDEYCIFNSMKNDLKFEVEKEVLPW